MSKVLRNSKSFSGNSSSLKKTEDESSNTYSYLNLCKENFRNPNTTSQFSRKNLLQPLLIHTPDEKKETVHKIWRTIVRFVTESVEVEVVGNSSSISSLSQGSVSVPMRLAQDVSQSSKTSVIDLTTISSSYQQETKSTVSGTWNSIRLKHLKAKFLQGLKRSSTNNLSMTSPTSIENSLESPFEQVQYIIGWALLQPDLRDEIYCMILRQLTNNPHKSYRLRGWILLNLVVAIFLPSDKVFLYVAKFIDDGPAVFSSGIKKLFVCSITDGPRHQPPSYVEYLAAIDRKPIELEVTLMDGSSHTISVDSSVTSSEIVSNIAKLIDLQDRFGFSLFIAMENRVTSLGAEGDKVFDAVSQCEQLFRNKRSKLEVEAPWRLFMRKEMFSPWDDELLIDPVAINLIYAQITRGIVLGEYVCATDFELASLAAKQYYCEFENDINEVGIMNLLASYIPSQKLGNNSKLRTWAKYVVQCYRRLFKVNEDEEVRPQADQVKGEVVRWAKTKWSSLFCRYFDVCCLEGGDWCNDKEKICMAINSNGVWFSAGTERKKLFEASFSQIGSIFGEGQDPELKSITADVINIRFLDGTIVKLESADANIMYRIMTHCINGLKERSVWAVAKTDYKNSSSNHLEISDGDLIKLERPAKQEAMISLIAACANMTTNISGKIPSELLHVIATLEEPDIEEISMKQSPRK